MIGRASASHTLTIAGQGGVERVVSALRAHPHRIGVQIAGTEALFVLGLHKSNMLRAVAAGALEVLPVSMRAQADSDAVQEFGCGILAGLTYSESNKASAVRARARAWLRRRAPSADAAARRRWPRARSRR